MMKISELKTNGELCKFSLVTITVNCGAYVDLLILRNRLIGPVGRVLANGPGDLGLIPVRVISKTLKMVLDTSLLNTRQY